MPASCVMADSRNGIPLCENRCPITTDQLDQDAASRGRRFSGSSILSCGPPSSFQRHRTTHMPPMLIRDGYRKPSTPASIIRCAATCVGAAPVSASRRQWSPPRSSGMENRARVGASRASARRAAAHVEPNNQTRMLNEALVVFRPRGRKLGGQVQGRCSNRVPPATVTARALARERCPTPRRNVHPPERDRSWFFKRQL